MISLAYKTDLKENVYRCNDCYEIIGGFSFADALNTSIMFYQLTIVYASVGFNFYVS